MHSRSRSFPGGARRPSSHSPARWPLLAIVAAISVALAAPLALAAEGGMYDGPQVDEDPTAVRQIPGQPLSLDEAIALGLRNNLNVEISRYAPYIAELDEAASWGAYDPVFTGNLTFVDDQLPTGGLVSPVNDDTRLTGDAGLDMLVPYLGAKASFTFESNEANTTTNAFQIYSPQFNSGFDIGVEVPLMRGLIWNEAWTQVRTLKFASEQSHDDFETAVMDVVQGIINTYWNLVATAEQLRVAEKALETNYALLEQTQTQYDVGVVSKVEVVEAEAGVASSEFNRIVARNSYQNAQDQLIAALLGRRLTAATALTFSPTDNPGYETIEYVDVEAAVATAFTKRPEIRSAEHGIDQAEVQQRFARNQRLPDISFIGGYNTQGITGSENLNRLDFAGGPPVGSIPPSTYGDSFDQWGGSRQWIAGGRVSIPLPNTTARKNYNRSEFELRRAESRRTQLKQGIIVDIRSAARGLIASAEGVEAAERRRLAAAEQLRAERIRLEHGESTPFDVLLRQNDLVDAESQKVTALQAFRESQARLDRQMGTILDVHNVQIEQVRSLD